MLFEIARRHKIMNPGALRRATGSQPVPTTVAEKMRSDYGKMMYMLQDVAGPDVQQLLQVACVDEIDSVFSFLQKKHVCQRPWPRAMRRSLMAVQALGLLADPLVKRATVQIMPDNKPRLRRPRGTGLCSHSGRQIPD